MLRKSDLWVAAAIVLGLSMFGFLFAGPRMLGFAVIPLFLAIGCILMSGRARVQEREVSNTRSKGEWDTYE